MTSGFTEIGELCSVNKYKLLGVSEDLGVVQVI